MKQLISTAALITVVLLSGPALAQSTDTTTDGNTANSTHTETTAGSMQADSTKSHHAMKNSKHSAGMNKSEANNGMMGRETIRAPRGTGAGQQRDTN